MNYNIQTPFRVRWSSERGDRQQRNDPEQSASSVQFNVFPNNVSIPSTIPGDSVNEQKTISGLSASLDITTKKMALQSKEYERCIDGATGDDDRMSVASDATTVFGGSLQEREVAARASRQRPSSMCKKFVELYDDAKASDDVDAQITLDDDRREVIRAASQFIESMRLSYPEMTGKDLATKMRIEFYLQKLSALFEVRPLFTPTLRDHPAYALHFPNVKALWATSEQAEKRKERDETQLDLEPDAKRCPTIKSTEVKEQNVANYVSDAQTPSGDVRVFDAARRNSGEILSAAGGERHPSRRHSKKARNVKWQHSK